MGIGQAGCSAGSLGGKRWGKMRVSCPEHQNGKAPPFSYTIRPLRCHLVTDKNAPSPPRSSQPQGRPFLADSFPTNYMDWISSPKDSPAVWYFPAYHLEQEPLSSSLPTTTSSNLAVWQKACNYIRDIGDDDIMLILLVWKISLWSASLPADMYAAQGLG